jgi:hypothetical protein
LVVRYYDQFSKNDDDFLLEEEWRQEDSVVIGVAAKLGQRGEGPRGLRVVRDLQEIMK